MPSQKGIKTQYEIKERRINMCGFLLLKILGTYFRICVPQNMMIAVRGAVSRLHGNKMGRNVAQVVITRYVAISQY